MPLLPGFHETTKALDQLRAHSITPGTSTDELVNNLTESLNSLKNAAEKKYGKENMPENVTALIQSAEKTLRQASPNTPEEPKPPTHSKKQ